MAQPCCGRLKVTRTHAFCFVLWYFCVCQAAQQVFPIFMNYTPKWRCTKDPDNNTEMTYSHDCTVFEGCPSSNLDILTPPFYSAVHEFELYCGQKAYYAALVSTVQFAGVLVGTVSWGHLADKFGRKPVGLSVVVIALVAGVATGFANSWQMLAAVRFGVGFTVSGFIVVIYAHVTELIRPEHRMLLRGFFSWGFARMLLTLICFCLPHWRTSAVAFSTVIGVPALLILLFILPESPTWLESKSRYAEMEKAEAWIAKVNGVKFSAANKHELYMSNGAKWPSEDQQQKDVDRKIYTIRDLFSTRLLTGRTFMFCLMWFTACLTSFANDLNSSKLAGDFYVNQFLYSFMIAVSKAVLFFVDYYIPNFRRRTLHQGSLAVVIVGFSAIVTLTFVETSYSDYLITIINIASVLFIEYTWDACYLTAAEGYPTVVRAIGVGTCSFTARVGAILAPQLTYLSVLWPPAVFIVILVICVFTCTMSVLFLPETKGVELALRLDDSESATSPKAEWNNGAAGDYAIVDSNMKHQGTAV